jgi:hypothetical protein
MSQLYLFVHVFAAKIAKRHTEVLNMEEQQQMAAASAMQATKTGKLEVC